MNSIVSKIVAAVALCFSLQAFSEEENTESFTHWDNIVHDLRSSIQEPLPELVQETSSGLDGIEISAGAGLAFTFLALEGDPNLQSSGLLKGVSAQFGINLFHPSLFAEGAFRSYSTDSLSESVSVGLKEFELRIMHSHLFQKETLFRWGGGLSARYLDVSYRGGSRKEKIEYTTPSAVFSMGVARNFGKAVQIGPDVSYRSALVGDSIDRSSVDLNIRVNARF